MLCSTSRAALAGVGYGYAAYPMARGFVTSAPAAIAGLRFYLLMAAYDTAIGSLPSASSLESVIPL